MDAERLVCATDVFLLGKRAGTDHQNAGTLPKFRSCLTSTVRGCHRRQVEQKYVNKTRRKPQHLFYLQVDAYRVLSSPVLPV